MADVDDRWHTVNATALPPGITALVADGGPEDFAVPVPALLVQERGGSRRETRVVLGLLNTHRGEVEPYDVDEPAVNMGVLTEVHWPGLVS